MTFVAAADIESGATIDVDLCIVGAGAAGITIAKALAGSRLRIAVLTGGGQRFRHRDQLLYHGRNVGRESFSPGKARFRMFGGSTTRWAGQCRPLDRLDFEARPGLPDTGWPIGRDDLEPFYRRAAALCDLDDWRFERPALLPPQADDDGIVPIRYRHGHHIDFARAYGEELRRASNIDVLLDMHAVDLVGTDRRLDAAIARAHDGRTLRVRAQRFVLACGGIENARLLLAATAAGGRGLGNERDLVGRYFMDHPFFFGGVLTLADGLAPDAVGALDGYECAGVAQRTHAAFALSEAVRRRERLNGAAVFFVRRPAHKSTPAFLSTGGVALTRVSDVLTHREMPDGRFLRHLGRLVARPREVIRSLGERVGGTLGTRTCLAARFTLEALPERDSRVRLEPARRDRFGLPRVAIEWRLHERDILGLERLRSLLPAFLGRHGLGDLVLRGAADRSGFPVALEGGKHHMGTTRMSRDPACGVVDPDGRLFGCDNLYIAGSSVFPTGGYANPTLTIVALALRLADHLGAGGGAER